MCSLYEHLFLCGYDSSDDETCRSGCLQMKVLETVSLVVGKVSFCDLGLHLNGKGSQDFVSLTSDGFTL